MSYTFTGGNKLPRLLFNVVEVVDEIAGGFACDSYSVVRKLGYLVGGGNSLAFHNYGAPALFTPKCYFDLFNAGINIVEPFHRHYRVRASPAHAEPVHSPHAGEIALPLTAGERQRLCGEICVVAYVVRRTLRLTRQKRLVQRREIPHADLFRLL